MSQIGIIETDKAPKAVGAYSQGVEFNNVYYFSGQLGLDPKTMQLKEGFKDQLAQIMDNVDALLHCVGLTRRDVVKTTVFLTDLNHFPLVNQAYEGYFSAPYPARSCVQVSALPKGGLVEIEVIAARSF